MAPKPTKPDKKVIAPIKELDAAIAKSRKTKADTKALEAASNGMKAADKALYAAMKEVYQAFEHNLRVTGPLLKPPGPGPVPIPYPIVTKTEKATKSALKKMVRIQSNHDNVYTKLIKTLGKEAQALKSDAKKSSGDEAGTLKGLISSQNMARAKYMSAASNVKAEGSKVLLHLDNVGRAIKKIEKKK